MRQLFLSLSHSLCSTLSRSSYFCLLYLLPSSLRLRLPHSALVQLRLFPSISRYQFPASCLSLPTPYSFSHSPVHSKRFFHQLIYNLPSIQISTQFRTVPHFAHFHAFPSSTSPPAPRIHSLMMMVSAWAWHTFPLLLAPVMACTVSCQLPLPSATRLPLPSTSCCCCKLHWLPTC